MEITANRRRAFGRWLLPVSTALLNLLYLVPPFDSSFKLAAGVLLLGWGSFLIPRTSLITNAIISGLLTVLLRMTADLAFLGRSFSEAAKSEIPSLAFYLVYGLLLAVVVPARFLDPLSAFRAAGALAVCDIAGNLADSMLRGLLTSAMLQTILAVALLRATASMAAAVAYGYHKSHLAEEEQRARYVEQTMRVAQLRAETVYLQKSGRDIERVMKQGYAMYEQFSETPEIARPALEIARSIHEVGKDYRRIVSELHVLIGEAQQQTMPLSEVLTLVQESTERLFATIERPPGLSIHCSADGPISQFYSMLSVINNLVINAAQAAGEDGVIRVDASLDENRLMLIISDNGPGIEEELLEDIFLPGFTTKFDTKTGESSAGIGLCHVKNLVEEGGGTITVQSVSGKGARFTVIIPRSKKQERGEDLDGNIDDD